MVRTSSLVCVTIVGGDHTHDVPTVAAVEGYVEVIKGIEHSIQAMISQEVPMVGSVHSCPGA